MALLLASSIEDKPPSRAFVPIGQSPSCLLPWSRTSLPRAPSFRSDGVPPTSFLGREQALSHAIALVGRNPACLLPRSRTNPSTCHRFGQTESRLLTSSINDKPFRGPSFWSNKVRPAFFLVRGQALPCAIIPIEQSPVGLLPRSMTSPSARLCSDRTESRPFASLVEE